MNSKTTSLNISFFIFNLEIAVEKSYQALQLKDFLKLIFVAMVGKVQSPVLYTVGLQTTFWNMNYSVWAVQAAQEEK